MYKLLIVDDEQIVTDSIQFMVKKFMRVSMQMETAHSGREAIEKAVSCRPDFVIIDIKMPGISGLEAIREIKSIYSGALFIIISAFAKFDYAKEAIQLGVIEYINKPLTRASLVSALNNAIKIKDQEQSKLKAELDYKEKMAYARPALENSLIHYITLPDDHAAEVEALGKILDLDKNGGYVMTVEFDAGKSGKMLGGVAEFSAVGRKIYSALRETVREANGKSIIGPLTINRVVSFIPCDEDEETSGLATDVYEKLRETGAEMSFHVGVGKRYASLCDIYRSYEESIRAIDSVEEEGVIHIDGVRPGSETNRRYPQKAEKMLLKKTASGETNEALTTFEYLFDWFREHYGDSTEELKSGLIRLVVILFSIPNSRSLESDSPADDHYVREFLSLQSQEAVRVWLRDAIGRISGAMAEICRKELSPVMKIAVDYIAQNYRKNITLEDVSSAVNVSPTYFSRMFKEEIGSTFIDYLTMLRIRQAKQMIGDGRLGNKEICDAVGYSDPNYFSRVFKKIVGVTPTEYRSSLSSR